MLKTLRIDTTTHTDFKLIDRANDRTTTNYKANTSSNEQHLRDDTSLGNRLNFQAKYSLFLKNR